MKLKLYRYIFFLTIKVFLSTALAHTYVRPLPSMPKTVIPPLAVDIFSYSLVSKVHATLFKLDENKKPIPNLVKDFKVSQDGLIYTFYLKKVFFHNGRLLENEDIKKSLEYAITKRAINYEYFNKIKGYDEFIANKTHKIEGIILPKLKNQLIIRLKIADYKLIHKLSDVTFSIWDAKQEKPINGLGDFKISSWKNNVEINLDYVGQKTSGSVKKIRLVKKSKRDAIEGFKRNSFDDLFFYPIFKKNVEILREFAHIQKTYFPRTYYFAVNSRRIKNKRVRQLILQRINVNDLVKRCFYGEKPTNTIIPPGFLGHDSSDYGAKINQQQASSSEQDLLTSISVKVIISEAIGSEKCIKSYLNDLSNSTTKIIFNVEILPISNVAKSWINNSIDAYIAYAEGESAMNYFGNFSPGSSFPLGLIEDEKFNSIFSKYMSEKDDFNKLQSVKKLENHIKSNMTFKPLFHPDVFFIYSKKYKKIKFSFESISSFEVKNLSLANKL
ncbi:ABC transporter substrate-binding protein [bacterium]|nr:ABC transporter substrate-binding protein [bacterium]